MTILSIPLKKIGRAIAVDTASLIGADMSPADFDTVLSASPALRYGLVYGLTQSLNDAHAAEAKPDDVPAEKRESHIANVFAIVQKKLDAILAGTVKQKGTGAVGATSVEREAFKLARKWWKKVDDAEKMAAIGKLRGRDDLTDSDDETIAEIIIAANAAHASTVKKAEAIVAANAIKVESDFNVDDLLGGATEEEIDAT